jgi:hypothetical protein
MWLAASRVLWCVYNLNKHAHTYTHMHNITHGHMCGHIMYIISYICYLFFFSKVVTSVSRRVAANEAEAEGTRYDNSNMIIIMINYN